MERAVTEVGVWLVSSEHLLTFDLIGFLLISCCPLGILKVIMSTDVHSFGSQYRAPRHRSDLGGREKEHDLCPKCLCPEEEDSLFPSGGFLPTLRNEGAETN